MRKTQHLLSKLEKIREVRERWLLKVKDLMTHEVLTVDKDATVVAAAQRMLEHRIHALVVTDDGKPAGIITSYDLVLVMTLSEFDKTTKVEKVMVSDLVTIGPDEHLREALKKIIEYDIRRLVVTDDDKVVGILSLVDIILGFAVVPEGLLRDV